MLSCVGTSWKLTKPEDTLSYPAGLQGEALEPRRQLLQVPAGGAL